MPTLRLTQSNIGPDRYRVEVALEGDGLVRQTATADFDFKLTPQDQEDLRWYLEDFLQYPFDPAPLTAARVEARMAEIGAELFRAVFQADDDARDLWATLRAHLNQTRVEIITGVREAAAIPWELIRDPKTDTPLALRACAFVRAQPQAALTPTLPRLAGEGGGPIRILLVICRPRLEDDVPFRSVATRLLKGLNESARQVFQLDVLRPPTFECLGRVLRQARAEGQPYHVVHFDGHGMYGDVQQEGGLANVLKGLNRLLLSGPRAGMHGYLLFENPDLGENIQLVDGPALGKLLVETGVPVLVLNACRSAHAEVAPTPAPTLTPGPHGGADAGSPSDGKAAHSGGEGDVHTQVRAFGSLAQEVMDAGVAGVIAMRYNVYVVTAAQFVADLYAALAGGHPLGEAATLGRKQLHAQPLRTIAYDPRPLQDWPVPVVYEAAPIQLFPKSAAAQLTVSLTSDLQSLTSNLQSLPPSPDAGFYGRDETLLALDRAFDSQPIVLLHAYAGSGKTATAAEFARWYALTGGLQGPVLFTSFEQYKPLARVLDQLGTLFGPALEQAGVHWLALEDADRQAVAVQVLKQIPVLWIWDNVEPVAGFPAGTPPAWSAAEQRALADFLRAARDTRAKFLLTSRRDERGWLGDLPRRIGIPPMPMQERVQLARALAEKQGRRLSDVDDWQPLLRFTGGNPLTITVLVGQALRDGLKTHDEIEDFVRRLRAGEAAFADEASEGRTKSLGASLGYGFEHAFSEAERRQLALLHFFQGFVDVDALCVMGNPKNPACLPEVRGLTREAGIALLDRAAEIGLLTPHGGGYYSIHPALPWYFRSLFEQYYGAGDQQSAISGQPSAISSEQPAIGGQSSAVSGRLAATRAFVEAMGVLGDYYHDQYTDGNRDVIAALDAEEANLLHARQLARANGWWGRVISAMQGLVQLYDHTGRRAEWARLVAEITPDFVDEASGGPLPGREEEWSLVTQYRVLLAREGRRWAEAERLQRVCVDWDRRRAGPALALPPEKLDGAGRNAIRSLAASLHDLGQIQRELSQAECVAAYEESLKLSEQIGEQAGAAICAFNLGHTYKDLSALRDLAQAERWYRRSLELRDERDRLGRGKVYSQLGIVAYERFMEARAANQLEEELLRHLNAAARFYGQALDLLPPNAVGDLATTHNALGVIYRNAGDLERALAHYREAIRYLEAAGDLYRAAASRFNVALALRDADRLPDARAYAEAALRNYQTYGDRAAEDIQDTQRLIAAIEERLKRKE